MFYFRKKDSRLSKRELVMLLLMVIVLVWFVMILMYRYVQVFSYYYRVLPNTYIGNYSISDVSFDDLESIVSSFEDEVLNEKVTIKCNDKEYIYSYQELGVEINRDKIMDSIVHYQTSSNWWKLNRILMHNIDHTFSYSYVYDNEKLKEFLNHFKSLVDVSRVDGHFSFGDNRNLQYVSGVDGFSLDIDASFDALKKYLDGNKGNEVVEFTGTVDKASSDVVYQSIDTKVSSFTTTFNPYISRATNLRVGLNYIDGVILAPGEVFSFYKYAGPYNKKGYVFYYEYVGNGVCQIATTVYNAALLGGLEIVKRSPHSAKSPYVPGGLDATVASSSNGWNIDFQFRNTYSYPIYISAYAIGGEAHVDFWSNKDATGGKTYSTESVQIGTRGYTTYLHTYQDGVEISRDKIATTWYRED